MTKLGHGGPDGMVWYGMVWYGGSGETLSFAIKAYALQQGVREIRFVDRLVINQRTRVERQRVYC